MEVEEMGQDESRDKWQDSRSRSGMSANREAAVVLHLPFHAQRVSTCRRPIFASPVSFTGFVDPMLANTGNEAIVARQSLQL